MSEQAPYKDGFICGYGLEEWEGASWTQEVHATREAAIAAGQEDVTSRDRSLGFQTAAISCRKERMPCPIDVENACDQADNDEWGEAMLENWQDRVFDKDCAFMTELQTAINELWTKLEKKHDLWTWGIWFEDVEHHEFTTSGDQ